VKKKLDNDGKEIKIESTTTKIKAGKAMKIRIYPNKKQIEDFKKFEGSSRFIYNSCLKHLNEQKNVKGLLNKGYLRSKFVNNINYEKNNTWMLNIPYDIRDEAMSDLLKNYFSNFSKSKITNTPFNLKYRTLKDKICSIAVLSKH
jgi:putative transposase